MPKEIARPVVCSRKKRTAHHEATEHERGARKLVQQSVDHLAGG